MKILFTSVGRRVELIQAFKNAAQKNNIDLEIFGADITDTAPALYFCDSSVMVPRISDENYIPFLKKFCKDNAIDAIIPTIDTDLMLLAENRDLFGDTKVFVGSAKKISLCRDKRLTADYLCSLGLKSPAPVDNYNLYNSGFPAFIKPRDGSSSVYAYKVENKTELITYSERVPDYIIQPFIDGTEYTIDIFCDFEGNPLLITPRIRLSVRAGEVMKTVIVQDDKIIKEAKILVNDFKPRGQITVQLIRENSTGEDYFIEINPRFGGGAPLSIKAGADSAEMLLMILKGKNLYYKEKAAEDGALFCRFDQSIRIG